MYLVMQSRQREHTSEGMHHKLLKGQNAPLLMALFRQAGKYLQPLPLSSIAET